MVALLALFGQSTTVWRSLRAHFWLANRLTAWIVLAVAPVYSLFFVSTELQGSRYLYLSCCAWSILLAHMVDNSFTSSVVGRLGRSLACTTLVAVGVAGVTLHLEPWKQAAEMRDAVLRSAQSRLANTRCLAASFEGLPDSIEGAYVFGNGFTEAMRLEGDSEIQIQSGVVQPNCSFRWTGDSFQPSQ